MARTFIQARKEILDTLAANGWTLSDTHLKVPHATSPAGRYRLWFKAQAVYFTRIGVPRPGMDDAFAVVHSFKDARTLSYTLDIRKASAVAFVTWIAKVYPDSGQTLPVRPSPYTTSAPLVEKPKPPRSKYESVAKLNRPYIKGIKWPDPTDEEFDRAQKDIGYLNERELRGILSEYGVYYHASDSLSVLRTVARENLDEKFPVTAVPRSEADPRQTRWAAAGKRRHGKGGKKRAGGKRRHGREPQWYELQGKWVLELGKKGFAHIWPDEEKLGYGGWRARVYDAEGNLIHEGIPQGGLKHAKEWARMFLDVPAGRPLTVAIHARHSQRWGGGKRRHGTMKLAAEVDGLLRK